jgi:hypothetical protein
VEDVVEEDPKKEQFVFKLSPRVANNKTSRTYEIFAASKVEKRDWMEALRLACNGVAQSKESVEIEEKLRRNFYDIPAADLEFQDESHIIGKGNAHSFC